MDHYYYRAATQLSDIFEEIKPYNQKESGQWVLQGDMYRPRGFVYCAVSGGGRQQSILVKPTEKVCEIVTAALKNVFDPYMYFQIICNGNNCLVAAQYNQIIGSWWLTRLEVSELANLPK